MSKELRNGFQEIWLGCVRYQARHESSVPGWMGVEAFEWCDRGSNDWDDTHIRRVGTLQQLFRRLISVD